ncbi:MAG: hypothetical protein II877_13085 [Synergistaceae bacterium]|nr:hypothetical protein [Synergistaceae bacterium]MBQ6972133.1 hypothetical protein [Synergistaceae bacterium]
MLYDDEQHEAEGSRKTHGDRLGEKFSEGLSRITGRFNASVKRIKDHFALFRERIEQGGRHELTPQENLEKFFGKPSYVENLTFLEVARWLQDKRKGCDAVVFRLDDEKVREIFGSDEEANLSLGDDKYIAAFVMDGGTVKDRFLVQYETLDAQLEEALADGDYVL